MGSAFLTVTDVALIGMRARDRHLLLKINAGWHLCQAGPIAWIEEKNVTFYVL